LSAPHATRLTALRHLLLRPVQDGPHETPEWVDDGVPFLSVDGIVDNHLKFVGCRYVSFDAHAEYSRKSKPQRGDVLLTKAASIGKVAVVDTDMEFNVWSPLAILRPNPALLDSRFLYFALQAADSQDQLQTRSTENTQQNVAMSDIGELRIIAPPVIAQRAIANYLDRETTHMDALIDAKRRIVQLLDEKRSALATSLLLGPPLDGGSPGPGQVTLRAGWSLVPFRRLFREIDDRSKSGSETLFSVSQTRGVIPQSELGDRRQYAETLAGYKICRKGDLVVNRMWVYYGALGVAPGIGIVSPDYAVFRPIADMASEFAAYVLRTPAYVAEMTRLVRGIGAAFQGAVRKPRLHPHELGTIQMPVSAPTDQSQLLRTLDQRTGAIAHQRSLLDRSLSLLRERRQALITGAVTGQLEIPETT
jgi:type I restriction enzyme S subunit